MKKKLIIVDISSFIFRAFYAIRMLNSPDGTPVNAVHGVWSMIFKLITKYGPTHIILARDQKGPNFRHELYEDYKANRVEPPEELVPQFSLINELVDKMGLLSASANGFEADDIIASICEQWSQDFDEVIIASSDKDLMQLIDGNIRMLDTMKDKFYDKQAVFEKMGVWPDQIVDYLSIVGDASDNIPGMKGIGAKGAAKLLEEYSSLDNCIQHKDELKGKRLTTAFSDHLDDAMMSRKLITIVKDLDLGSNSNDSLFSFSRNEKLEAFLESLGMKTALKKLKEIEQQEYKVEQTNKEGSFKVVDTKELPQVGFTVIENELIFESVLKKIQKVNRLVFHTEYNSEEILMREIVSISIAMNANEIFYFPFAHGEDLLSKENNLPKNLLLKLLNCFWSDSKKTIITSHSKRDFSYALSNHIEFNAYVLDLVQLHYVVDPSSSHKIEKLLNRYLNIEVDDRPKDALFLNSYPAHDAAEIISNLVAGQLNLAISLEKQIQENSLSDIYKKIDLPLLKILNIVEGHGVLINVNYLKELEIDFEEELIEIENKITGIIGESINLRSPKQVGTLLFETLGLPIIKKTKTGFSTDSSVLEELLLMGESDIPEKILRYRELDKLQSTYVKVLPKLINEKSGRIHTNFSLHTAATGRLSSTHPNLQNIPVRSIDGRRLRKAFIATPGMILLSADYSQVELRLLAHFSKDDVMVEAFNNDDDIHTQTAAEILGKKISDVSKEERSNAKAVNFGLMYGQSSFGLSKELKISRNDAKEYITKYFERFSSVKSYLDSLKEKAEIDGFAQTMHGRKRPLSEINSSNRNIKSQAERVSINSPIQGTAADIIKLAMIKIDEEFQERNIEAKMILQVHDELIFELKEEDLEAVHQIVKSNMESVVSIDVPLKVDVKVGVNWLDLK